MRLRRGSMLLRSGSKFNAPAARFKWFNAASQRFKWFKSCYAAFKDQSETEGLTRCEAALPAPQALYPQLSCLTRRRLYTRFSALNA